jgi:hypothetical protein
MYTNSRDEEVAFLKRLWTSQPTMCPKCGVAELEYLHRKAKRVTVIGSVLPVMRYIEQ